MDAHPELEGKYFVFDFGADYTADSALVIMQVIGGQLEDAWNPCDINPIDEVGEYLNEHAIQYLKEHGVTEVYTLDMDHWTSEVPKEFLGRGLSWDNGCEWGEYTPLAKQREYWEGYFRCYGIKINFFNDYR